MHAHRLAPTFGRPPRVPAARPQRPAPRTLAAAATPPRHSPQNTDAPTVGPDPAFDVLQAVQVQLDALADVDHPWDGHGTQVAYAFCRDSGSLEMSRYFGTSSSLYHEDHYVGKLRTQLPELMPPHPPAKIVGKPVVLNDEEASTVVRVAAGDRTLAFRMVRCEIGRRKGAWVTASVTPVVE